jgi:hypothetical protein
MAKSHIFNAGDRYGRLTIIKYSKTDNFKRKMWSCKCDCGIIKDVLARNLFNGTTQSCGCLQKELAKKLNTKHDLCQYRLYGIFKEIKSRCENKNNWRYKYYGARGISIYQEWLDDPKKFIDWIDENLGARPTKKHSLDRIDNDGNYEPGNLRWADTKTQSRNRSCTKLTKEKAEEIKKSSLSIKELSKIYHVGKSQISAIINGKAWSD